MDPIKEAFRKVREDIDFLFTELQSIKKLLTELKEGQPTLQHINPSNQHINPSSNTLPTQIPTHNYALEGSESQNNNISTGNEGVPTNQPTDQPTNQHPFVSYGNSNIEASEDKISQLRRMNEIIDSLDAIKKEVRVKFKQLTEQEMAIFAAIYQLEEQGLLVDYSLLAERFSLTEISIRDYIRKITKKGVEIIKEKQNNKKIVLKIPLNLKKIASLHTILQLREL